MRRGRRVYGWTPPPPSPAVAIHVGVSIDIERLAQLPPDKIAAVLDGIAQVVAASGDGKA